MNTSLLRFTPSPKQDVVDESVSAAAVLLHFGDFPGGGEHRFKRHSRADGHDVPDDVGQMEEEGGDGEDQRRPLVVRHGHALTRVIRSCDRIS